MQPTTCRKQKPDAATSGLAIAALVLGILSVFTCLITALPAIILGIVAIAKITAGRGQLKGYALAVTGMAMPIVALGTTTAFMVIMIARFGALHGPGGDRQMICSVHMYQVGDMLRMYASDNDDRYPPAEKWCDLLEPYRKSDKSIFVCPSGNRARSHYAINPSATPGSPPDIVLLFETDGGWNQSGGPEILSTRNHRGRGCNILFNEGEVRFVETEFLEDLRWTP